MSTPSCPVRESPLTLSNRALASSGKPTSAETLAPAGPHAPPQDARRKELDTRAPVSKQRAKRFNLEEELQVGAAAAAARARSPTPQTAHPQITPPPPRPLAPQRLKGSVDLDAYENKPVPRPKD